MIERVDSEVPGLKTVRILAFTLSMVSEGPSMSDVFAVTEDCRETAVRTSLNFFW